MVKDCMVRRSNEKTMYIMRGLFSAEQYSEETK